VVAPGGRYDEIVGTTEETTTFLKHVQAVEAARETMQRPSFMAGLFAGQPQFELLAPAEAGTGRDAEFESLLERLEAFLRERVDAEAIEREAEIPREVLTGLAELGAFGINIPKEYVVQNAQATQGAAGQYSLPIVETIKSQQQNPAAAGGAGGTGTADASSSASVTPEAGASGAGATKAVNVSMTGRVCNPTFDVMHFKVVVDIDSRFVQSFISNLTNDRFLTVLKVDMKGVDLERAWQRGYDYGNSPVVTLQVQCEAIFLRDWTVWEKDPKNPSATPRPGPMPASVQAILGVQKEAPAAAPVAAN